MSAEPLGEAHDQAQLNAWVANAMALTAKYPRVAMVGRIMCRDGVLIVWFRGGHVVHCGPLMGWN